jgi:hypothetical protein
MRLAWHVARTGYKTNVYSILVGMKQLGRTRRRWDDNMKMDLREVEWNGMDLTDLPQDRTNFAGSYEHGNEPSRYMKCWEVLSN